MNEYVLIFEQTSYLELDKYVLALYSSFDRLVSQNEVENLEKIISLPKIMIDNAK